MGYALDKSASLQQGSQGSGIDLVSIYVDAERDNNGTFLGTADLAFSDAISAARVLKQEEPFPCIRCGKPFGVKSTIERVVAKLERKHWMYQNSPSRLDVIKMCEDCRVAVVTEEGFDPNGAPGRPKPRTTDDYLRERKRNQ